MTAEQLKASVLQMAIEGKLVPQLDDEPAVDIEAVEPEEVPFAIPEKWKWVRFLSVITIATNLVDPKNYQNYMHIAPDNIEKKSGRLLECRTVKEDKIVSGNHLFRKGQILYSKIRPLLRKAVIAPFDGLCSADMYPLDTNLNKEYVLYYLLSEVFNHQIIEAMSSRVKMPKINKKELENVYFPLPPYTEQERIVARLNEILPLIEEYGKAHSALKNAEEVLPDQLRASLLQEAIQGKLVPQLDDEPAVEIAGEEPDEVPFAIPEKWKWVKLEDICLYIQRGKSPKYSDIQQYPVVSQ